MLRDGGVGGGSEEKMKVLRNVVVASGLSFGAAALVVAAAVASGVYLPPTHSRGGAVRLCPSPAGLERFSGSAIRTAKAEVMRYGRVSKAEDLTASDPAWQPSARAMWDRRGFEPGHGPQFVLGPIAATPVAKQSYGVIVRHSCGSKILLRTLEFTSVPGHRSHPPTCNACRTTFFVIDRVGHPLIYFVY